MWGTHGWRGKSDRDVTVTRPRWSAYGGNGSVVPMTQMTMTGVRDLLEVLWAEGDLLFPNVDAQVRAILAVQYVATLVELQEGNG